MGRNQMSHLTCTIGGLEMKKVNKESYFFEFNRENDPVLNVLQDEYFLMEVHDVRRGRLMTNDQVVSSAPDWNEDIPKTCPCSGPAFFEGVKAGETIKITIHDIQVSSKGFVLLKESMGICKEMVAEPIAIFGKLEKGIIKLDCGLEITPRVHIGTIGTTPRQKIATAFPGDHGGNLDCPWIKSGSELYLPVYFDGALLGLGDLHAAMGEGELMGAGVETGGVVLLSGRSVPEVKVERPVVRTRSEVITLASGRGIREAVKTAAKDLIKLLVSYGNISQLAALTLLTASANVKVCQMCDENLDAIVGIAIDKKYLPLP